MKLKSLLFSSLMLLSAGTAWADVTINATNFPDSNFRNYLLSQDYGSDRKLTDAEIEEVNSLMLSSKSIQNLNGIKNFTALQYLSCDGNQLTSLDVSGCKSLIELDCSNNQLTSLNVSGCSALTSIICAQNQLKGNAINDLIAGLPTTQNGGLYIINVKSDGNAITREQVKSAKAKGWTSYALDGSWFEYAGDVLINATNFPDENFRSWLLSKDYGTDGFLTGAEIANVTWMYVSYEIIQSLKGIEYFTALTTLYCDNNQLTSLDVSGCTALTTLYCDNNQLTSLDVSGCTALTRLDCYSNQLTSLDVSKNTELTYLRCSYNDLTSLDVTKNTALTYLYCGGNQLTSLDVSKNTKLTELYCYRNQLTSLDVSKNTKLTELSCGQNRIKGEGMDALVASLPTVSSRNMYVIYNKDEQNVMTTIQVAAAKAKGWIPYYTNNGDTWYKYPGLAPDDIAIDEENFPDAKFRNYLLSWSFGSDGILTYNEMTKVTSIDVSDKSIRSLKGIEYFTALTSLSCYDNQLTSLDVSGCTALTELYCYRNQLTSLDVSGCTALTELYCYRNQLTSLDVSKNTALTTLYCFNNQLTSLDVSKNTALANLQCYNNQLTSLDVSKNTALTNLDCQINQLTSLDVSKNTALGTLYCNGNQLTSLDVSKNTELVSLHCYQNQIKGAAMDALVASLPVKSSRAMRVIYYENEQNVMTTTQVAVAKFRGWIPYYTENGLTWKEYAGVDPSTGVNNVEASDSADSAPWYTINGVKLTEKPTAPGIYIHNGKKVVVK